MKSIIDFLYHLAALVIFGLVLIYLGTKGLGALGEHYRNKAVNPSLIVETEPPKVRTSSVFLYSHGHLLMQWTNVRTEFRLSDIGRYLVEFRTEQGNKVMIRSSEGDIVVSNDFAVPK